MDLNPLAGEAVESMAPESRGGAAVATWSGWAEGDEVGLGTWGPAGWAGLAAWCDREGPGLAAAGREVWFRTHAGHVLSDAQRCLTFLRGREGQPFGVLVDPAAMLTEGMLADAEDHVRRILETVGEHPGARGLAIGGLGGGLSWDGALAGLVREHWAKPVVLLGPDHGAQRAALTGEGP